MRRDRFPRSSALSSSYKICWFSASHCYLVDRLLGGSWVCERPRNCHHIDIVPWGSLTYKMDVCRDSVGGWPPQSNFRKKNDNYIFTNNSKTIKYFQNLFFSFDRTSETLQNDIKVTPPPNTYSGQNSKKRVFWFFFELFWVVT